MLERARKSAQILLVEDSPDDVLLTREAFREAKIPNTLHVSEDGDLALAFLRRQPPYLNAPRPDLIILDFNLPRRDGREVLAELKADPYLKQIPVIVLTTSLSDDDIRHAYQQHANACIRKPADLEQFLSVVKAIDAHWLGVVTLPPS